MRRQRPPGPPGISPESPPGTDVTATTEQNDIDRGRLDRESQLAEHKRSERLRDYFGYGTIGLLCTAFILIFFAILSVGWHYLTPTEWHWLEKATLDTLTTTIFSGSLFVFFGLYIRDRLRL